MSKETEKPKKIYISGKITGLPYEKAFEKFERAENQLKAIGFEVVNPMKLDHKNALTWSDYMRTDIKALMECDNIFLLSNWRESKGAILEKQIADALDIREYYTINLVIAMLKDALKDFIKYRKQTIYN
jgi:hypothetical protein